MQLIHQSDSTSAERLRRFVNTPQENWNKQADADDKDMLILLPLELHTLNSHIFHSTCFFFFSTINQLTKVSRQKTAGIHKQRTGLITCILPFLESEAPNLLWMAEIQGLVSHPPLCLETVGPTTPKSMFTVRKGWMINVTSRSSNH